jgi:sulfate adenylyltransferase subunit 2
MNYQLTHLDALESEAIYIIREVIAEFERPALAFSGGKDSAVLLHLAVKACYPKAVPFPVLHIDTGQNFPEVLDYRDRRVAELGVRLLVGSVDEAIEAGEIYDDGGMRNRMQTPVLLKSISQHRFDAVFGGGRRDEEKARAKERVLSFRDEFGQWDPRGQRPELWNIYNGRHRPGEHFRVFPLSNFTELDIWQYIEREHIELPSIYYAHQREVFRRDGMLLATGPYVAPVDGLSDEEPFVTSVRYRTVGDMSCTAAVESAAATLEDIILETAAARVSERGATRADDRFSEAAMEDRKREGYF